MFNMLNKVKLHIYVEMKINAIEYLGDTDEVELEFYLTTPFASGMKEKFSLEKNGVLF